MPEPQPEPQPQPEPLLPEDSSREDEAVPLAVAQLQSEKTSELITAVEKLAPQTKRKRGEEETNTPNHCLEVPVALEQSQMVARKRVRWELVDAQEHNLDLLSRCDNPEVMELLSARGNLLESHANDLNDLWHWGDVAMSMLADFLEREED